MRLTWDVRSIKYQKIKNDDWSDFICILSVNDFNTPMIKVSLAFDNEDDAKDKYNEIEQLYAVWKGKPEIEPTADDVTPRQQTEKRPISVEEPIGDSSEYEDDEKSVDDVKSEYEGIVDGVKFFYENMSGEKRWHTIVIKGLSKDRLGNIVVLVDGRGGETIVYNTMRMLKMADGSNPQEFFGEMYAPIEAEKQKLVSDYKYKADNIIKAMEGFSDAKIFHCSIGNSIAISEDGIFSLMSKQDGNSFVKDIKDVTRITFNSRYLRCTIHVENFEQPTVEIEMSIDFGDPRELFDKLKAEWNRVRKS